MITLVQKLSPLECRSAIDNKQIIRCELMLGLMRLYIHNQMLSNWIKRATLDKLLRFFALCYNHYRQIVQQHFFLYTHTHTHNARKSNVHHNKLMKNTCSWIHVSSQQITAIYFMEIRTLFIIQSNTDALAPSMRHHFAIRCSIMDGCAAHFRQCWHTYSRVRGGRNHDSQP